MDRNAPPRVLLVEDSPGDVRAHARLSGSPRRPSSATGRRERCHRLHLVADGVDGLAFLKREARTQMRLVRT